MNLQSPALWDNVPPTVIPALPLHTLAKPELLMSLKLPLFVKFPVTLRLMFPVPSTSPRNVPPLFVMLPVLKVKVPEWFPYKP